jgi:hypothetical protein
MKTQKRKNLENENKDLIKIAYLKEFDNLYCATDAGDIFSVDRPYTNNRNMYKRIVRGKMLSKTTDKDGYYSVKLSYPKHKIYRIHRLVLMAFNPIKNAHLFQVNHINNIKNDNRLINLEWVSSSQNLTHAYKIGAKCAVGSRNGKSILDEKKAKEIKSLLLNGIHPKEIALIYNVSCSTIKNIKNKYSWAHVD